MLTTGLVNHLSPQGGQAPFSTPNCASSHKKKKKKNWQRWCRSTLVSVAGLLGSTVSGEQMHRVEMTTLLLLLPFWRHVVYVGIEATEDSYEAENSNLFSTVRCLGLLKRADLFKGEGVFLTMIVLDNVALLPLPPASKGH